MVRVSQAVSLQCVAYRGFTAPAQRPFGFTGAQTRNSQKEGKGWDLAGVVDCEDLKDLELNPSDASIGQIHYFKLPDGTLNNVMCYASLSYWGKNNDLECKKRVVAHPLAQKQLILGKFLTPLP